MPVGGPGEYFAACQCRGSDVDVVKGKESLRNISVDSQHGMREGEKYLLRTENAATTEKPYCKVDTIDSAIPVWRSEDIEALKKLAAGIVELRTTNMRIDDLESQKRRIKGELETLKKVRLEN